MKLGFLVCVSVIVWLPTIISKREYLKKVRKCRRRWGSAGGGEEVQEAAEISRFKTVKSVGFPLAKSCHWDSPPGKKKKGLWDRGEKVPGLHCKQECLARGEHAAPRETEECHSKQSAQPAHSFRLPLQKAWAEILRRVWWGCAVGNRPKCLCFRAVFLLWSL